MDGRGRLAQSLTRIVCRVAPWRARASAHGRAPSYANAGRRMPVARSGLSGRPLRRFSTWIFNLPVSSAVELAAGGLFLLATLAYGIVAGDHVPATVGALTQARDAAANAAGFRIASIALSGERHVSREEILSAAGITGTTSLLFFDVDAARDRLKTNPWIADATVLKLYPDRLQIGIKEREAYALWQQTGRVSVIAQDGTVLEPYVDPRLLRLPLVVGVGAAARAKQFLSLLDAHPELRDQVRASILIGERRWNLRLKNGLDIRLPENDIENALATLVARDRDKKLISRAILAIDLRLPDRVTVELMDSAAAARAEALKEKKAAKKGGSA
jgi:cell division protein FtsQ